MFFQTPAFVLLHPTETCYGLACRVHDEAAVKKLYEMKQMEREKPVSLLVKDLEMAQRYGVFSQEALELARKYWPGPLTLVLPRTALLPEWINPGVATVGMRVSSHPSVQGILADLNEPITTTSANVHGQKEAYSVEEALSQGLKPDAVIDEGVLPLNPPSTLVAVEPDGLRILRQGALKIV
jgi:L-threonylcarbamoyladenylate synthase